MPDFDSCIKANRIKWAIKLIMSEKQTWNIIPRMYVNQIGGFDHIQSNFDVERIPSFLPPFYSNILTNRPSQPYLLPVGHVTCIG